MTLLFYFSKGPEFENLKKYVKLVGGILTVFLCFHFSSRITLHYTK